MKTAIIVGSISLLISTLSTIGWHRNLQEKSRANLVPPTAVFGLGRYAAFIVVGSIDPVGKTLVGITRGNIVEAIMPTRFSLAEKFWVQKRDVVVENGVVVGVTETTDGELSDIVPGTRGYGVAQLAEDGTIELSYFLIGNPFPRP